MNNCHDFYTKTPVSPLGKWKNVQWRSHTNCRAL